MKYILATIIALGATTSAQAQIVPPSECGEMAKMTQEVFRLREQGWSKMDVLVALGDAGRELAQAHMFAIASAYSLDTGMLAVLTTNNLCQDGKLHYGPM